MIAPTKKSVRPPAATNPIRGTAIPISNPSAPAASGGYEILPDDHGNPVELFQPALVLPWNPEFQCVIAEPVTFPVQM